MQQINLYLPELQPKKEWLTANTLVLSLVGTLVLLSVFSFLGSRGNNALEANIVALENQQVAARAQMEEIKNRAKPLSLVHLDANIAALRARVKSRESIGKIIEFQNLGNANGFSGLMESLAQASVADISLKRFSFSKGGNYIQMEGETREPETIALVIDKLSRHDDFKNSTFGLLSIGKKNPSNRAFEFSVGFDSAYHVVKKDRKE